MDPQPLTRLTRGDAHWPADLDALDLLDAAPPSLWLAGHTEVLACQPRIAIVGTRAPTPYGEAQAERFAARLASAGMCVVSGLARGIDRVAHEAALDAGGRTIAVLGSGADRPWPTGRFTDRMRREALLVSEFSPGVAPRRHHFPLRNRLIAALSLGVVVIEAAQASGSLITARWGADLGKSVMAVPGRVDHPMAHGCHRLVREGAALVESPEDVLAELALEGILSAPAPDTGGPARTDALLAALEGETLNVDELCNRLSRPPGELLAALIGHEIEGRVVRAPGGRFRLAATR